MSAKKNGADGEQQKNVIWQDERFQHLVTDPRFRTLPKQQRKVKIDKRFQSMFTNEKFKVKYTVDKYGRRVNQSNADDLKKYYELESSSSSSEGEDADADADEDEAAVEKERRKEEKAIARATDDDDDDSGDGKNDALESDDESGGVPLTLKQRLCDPNIDYARGEGRLVTDSSSDEASTDDDEDNAPELSIDHVWGELDAEAPTTDESTNRLAVCNMDWDRIRASDLMVLFNSFLPPGGCILSVKIYPSEYGKERMAEEEQKGPAELVGLGKETKQKVGQHTGSDDDDDDDADEEALLEEQDSDAEEGDDYHMEKLRQYQLNRLRYYYAVIECDSVATADKIYKECDGIEYESSATRVDLRFIPDDTSFDDDEPTDTCTELPDKLSYKPRMFTTTALQQAKVDLTWDETAVERRELGDKLANGKLEDVDDRDLRKIIAYSSEEELEEEVDEENVNDADDDDDDDAESTVKNVAGAETKTGEIPATKQKKKQQKKNKIDAYKALLAEINEKEQKAKNQKYEMEYTWDISTQAKEDADEKTNTENPFDTNSKKKTPALTPIERELQKRNEKNKRRKEERKRRKLLAQGIDPDTINDDDNDDDSDSDSIPDGIDMNDPYFAEEFANGDFIEPKAASTKGAGLSKKAQKKQKITKKIEDEEEESRRAQELELLMLDDDLAEKEKNHFSLEKILKSEQETKTTKRKRQRQLKKSKSSLDAAANSQVEDNFQVNVNDDRFKNLYTSHLYNIDPTDSHFKKTKGMDLLIKEKFKRRHGNEDANNASSKLKDSDVNDGEDYDAKRPKKELENKLLINSLKRKLKMQK